jgi:[glutamine synthetase] adenylyltransferase / [glutamine synthetase]-adenylyl-L-tyrosine phosphorylase
MDMPALLQYLDDPAAAAEWLRGLGVADGKRGHANLVRIATCGVPLDLLAVICDQFAQCAGANADPEMAWNNFDRFVGAARNPLSLATLFERDAMALPTLLQIFSTSQHFSDLLVADPESYDLLRLTEGQPVARQMLVEDLTSEISVLEYEPAVLRALRRFKRREMLRIAYGDIIRDQSIKTVTAQISYLADAVVEAAVRAAWRKLERQRGTPRGPDGQSARFVVLGLGKLGGVELNYSSDIDLILLYDGEGRTDGKRSITNGEFFERLSRDLVGLLADATELGAAYRVDLRLRPDGERGPIVMSMPAALHYYDIRGRTWERQAFIKARPVAGDQSLGREFLDQMSPWIYRRYLSRADIGGIKALKRRIEQRTHSQGADAHDVKTGHGGIRDIEFVIQFLQLLNGGDLAALRTGNTLEAIVQLESVGCLSHQERTILEDNYGFLRKIEHRLQIMFDLQTHLLPEHPEEMRKLAMRMGYAEGGKGDSPHLCEAPSGPFRQMGTVPFSSALAGFEADYRNKTDLNRKILDHLLNDAFGDESGM